jgi:hypothetical protein
MSNAVREERRKPSRATFLLQFAATAAGFLVSTYLVSTVIFDYGPSQNISSSVRIAISGVALMITLGVVLGLAYATTRGYHVWKLEGGRLLIFRRVGQPPAVSLELRDVISVKAREEDWDVIARAEGDDLEAVGLQETGGDLPGEATRHHGELEIFAGGTLYVVHLESATDARQAAQIIESAMQAGKN